MKPADIRPDQTLYSLQYFLPKLGEMGYGEWTPTPYLDLTQIRDVVDSVFIRYPQPTLYTYYNNGGKEYLLAPTIWYAVLYDYVNNGFFVNDSQFLTELNGVYFKDLPQQLQRRLLETNIIVYRFPVGDNDPEKIDYLKRVVKIHVYSDFRYIESNI